MTIWRFRARRRAHAPCHPKWRSVACSVAGIVLAAALVAACGSSSSTTTSASSAAPAGSSPSSTAPSSGSASNVPYIVGVNATKTGPTASTNAQDATTATAWGMWTNAHGGIGGHPVKVIVLDDTETNATGLSTVMQMVQQDHVLAIIPSGSTETAYGPYTAKAGIPAIGGSDSAPLYETEGNFFSPGAPPDVGYQLEAKTAADAGLPKIAGLYCSEDPECASGIALLKKAGPKTGSSVVYTSAISSTATDYTAPCLALKSAGATKR
jgi:branched-chain amino acid transport system substrate-binding protein